MQSEQGLAAFASAVNSISMRPFCECVDGGRSVGNECGHEMCV